MADNGGELEYGEEGGWEDAGKLEADYDAVQTHRIPVALSENSALGCIGTADATVDVEIMRAAQNKA